MRVHGLWSFLSCDSVPEVGSYVLPLPSSWSHDSTFFWDSSSLLQEAVPILAPEADMGLRHNQSEHHISLAMVMGSGMGEDVRHANRCYVACTASPGRELWSKGSWSSSSLLVIMRHRQ